MTSKAYSEIQRQLGFIEGVVADTSNIIYGGVSNAINAIDEILEKEMASCKNARSESGDES